MAQSRNRVIYQSEALYVSRTGSKHTTDVAGTAETNAGCAVDQGASGGTGTGGAAGTAAEAVAMLAQRPSQLQRIQNANYSFSIERQDVNQFGELAAIDRVILSAPTVSLDFQYLLANMTNENNLGFHISEGSAGGGANWISCISGILDKSKDEKCYYIRTVDEGADALGIDHEASDQSVIGIGNGYITSYTTEGSVGNFPTVSLNVEALNMRVYNAISGENIPAVNAANGTANSANKFALPDAARHAVTSAKTSVLRPGDITFNFSTWDDKDDYSQGTTAFDGASYPGADVDVSDANLQSYNISFDLGRTPLEKLGSKFAFAREIDFPVTITMSVEANVADMGTGNLTAIVNSDENFDLSVYLKEPGTGTTNNAVYHLKKAKLDSQEFSSGIGDNKSVTLNFSAQVGGPNQQDVGFFMSGVTS